MRRWWRWWTAERSGYGSRWPKAVFVPTGDGREAPRAESPKGARFYSPGRSGAQPWERGTITPHNRTKPQGGATTAPHTIGNAGLRMSSQSSNVSRPFRAFFHSVGPRNPGLRKAAPWALESVPFGARMIASPSKPGPPGSVERSTPSRASKPQGGAILQSRAQRSAALGTRNDHTTQPHEAPRGRDNRAAYDRQRRSAHDIAIVEHVAPLQGFFHSVWSATQGCAKLRPGL